MESVVDRIVAYKDHRSRSSALCRHRSTDRLYYSSVLIHLYYHTHWSGVNTILSLRILSINVWTYPVIASLVLFGEWLELGLGFGVAVSPATAELLGDVSHSVLRIDSLHLGALVIAEPEERRTKGMKYSLFIWNTIIKEWSSYICSYGKASVGDWLFMKI